MITSTKGIVVLGADHNGVELKREVKALLQSHGYTCIDIGPHDTHNKVDYIDYAATVAQTINNMEADRGILICGTGVGMSIVANRYPNVRASLVHSLDVAHKTREHNDSNLLCLGAWVLGQEENLEIVQVWMDEKFGEGRHVPRVEKTKARPDQEKIVFTNGIFDIVHEGHLKLLKFAKSLGGKLVVGINSDRATKILKGADRPINSEKQRKSFLESFHFVDQVIIFDNVQTLDVIKELNPDIVVKGGEWTAEEVRVRDEIPNHIDIKVFPLVINPETQGEKYSTTHVIEKIKSQAK